MMSHPQLQQYAPIGIGAIFALTMFIWGIVLISGLSEGSERGAASGTAFIILGTITVGKGLLTYYKIIKHEEDELKTQKLAAGSFAGLFFLFILISGLIDSYRAMIILSSIAYGFLALAVSSLASVYLYIRQSDGGHNLLEGGNLGGIGSAV